MCLVDAVPHWLLLVLVIRYNQPQVLGLGHQRQPLCRIPWQQKKASAIVMFPDVVFIKIVFHVTTNFEYGLGLLVVDAEVELLETGKDLTELIHGGLKSLKSTEAPAKMTTIRIFNLVGYGRRCVHKRGQSQLPTEWETQCSRDVDCMSLHLLMSEKIADRRQPQNDDLLCGDVHACIAKGLLHIRPVD